MFENETGTQKVARLHAFVVNNDITHVVLFGETLIDFVTGSGQRIYQTCITQDERIITLERYYSELYRAHCKSWTRYPTFGSGVESYDQLSSPGKHRFKGRWRHPTAGSVYDVGFCQSTCHHTLDITVTLITINDYGPFTMPQDMKRHGVAFWAMRPTVFVDDYGRICDKTLRSLFDYPVHHTGHKDSYIMELFRDQKLLGYPRSECGVSSENSIIGWYEANR